MPPFNIFPVWLYINKAMEILKCEHPTKIKRYLCQRYFCEGLPPVKIKKCGLKNATGF